MCKIEVKLVRRASAAFLGPQQAWEGAAVTPCPLQTRPAFVTQLGSLATGSVRAGLWWLRCPRCTGLVQRGSQHSSLSRAQRVPLVCLERAEIALSCQPSLELSHYCWGLSSHCSRELTGIECENTSVLLRDRK